VCGEQLGWTAAQKKIRGSPPRVRGTVDEDVAARTQDRITPACAGNSAVSDSPRWTWPDHPRVCGEQ